jgi:hypothetical protein
MFWEPDTSCLDQLFKGCFLFLFVWVLLPWRLVLRAQTADAPATRVSVRSERMSERKHGSGVESNPNSGLSCETRARDAGRFWFLTSCFLFDGVLAQ